MSQPRHGFRAGLDSVLLGAAVSPAATALLDLGCGVGTAGLVALTHNPNLAATLLDQNADMLALAQRNAHDNGFADRVTLIPADVAGKGADRRAAGLRDNAYSSVIANPPFFDSSGGTPAQQATRADARHMRAEHLDLWVKTAAGAAAAGGEIIFIYPAASLVPLLAAFAARFGAMMVLPLVPRDGEPASRVLVRAIKGSRAPLTLLASRPLHEPEGRAFTAQFDAILRGTARLDW
ncbi:tRNA1(Val) (adenine(37)-N6)-methyltransferase [uncultured Devosia sp.]|uniref:tRNA1(Val) (adenine(37)-N6)-methyltransferase n=1 Tax=uncultured Devosia sp. TaxID=211434 RepID=UPI0035CB5CE1